jgi:hypothetical protein
MHFASVVLGVVVAIVWFIADRWLLGCAILIATIREVIIFQRAKRAEIAHSHAPDSDPEGR